MKYITIQQTCNMRLPLENPFVWTISLAMSAIWEHSICRMDRFSVVWQIEWKWRDSKATDQSAQKTKIM